MQIILTESKFNAWRACIAIIHLDHKITAEEQKWALKTISNPIFSEAQREILKSDLNSNTSFDEILKMVTDKKDLSFVLDTFRVIANIDHHLSIEEKNSFKNLETKVLEGLNLKEIESKAVLSVIERYHEDHVYESYNKSSIFENTFNSFLKFINPGDYKFPDKN